MMQAKEMRAALLGASAAICVALPNQASAAERCLSPYNLDDVITGQSRMAETFVAARNIKAPEAARLYAMNAIVLHDSWMAASGKPTFTSGVAAGPDGGTAESLRAASMGLMQATYPSDAEVFREIAGLVYCQWPEISMPSTGSALVRGTLELSPNNVALVDDRIAPPRAGDPGVWVQTASYQEEAVLPHWGELPPMVLASASKYRPEGPPDMESREFAAALFEVQVLGAQFRSKRTPEQSDIARFWADGDGTSTGPGHWNAILRSVDAGAETGTRLKNLLALNVAMYDAGIAAWDAKYAFSYWRPETAISAYEESGQIQTAGDHGWHPYLKSPYHPEYVSGHSTFSAAAATVLTARFGEQQFCSRSESLVSHERCFDNFAEAAAEAGRSRIFGGIHYSFSNEDGLALGRQVARDVLTGLETRLGPQVSDPGVIVSARGEEPTYTLPVVQSTAGEVIEMVEIIPNDRAHYAPGEPAPNDREADKLNRAMLGSGR